MGGGLRISPTASQQQALAMAMKEHANGGSGSPSASAVLFPAKMSGFRWSFNSAKSTSASSLGALGVKSGDAGTGGLDEFSRRPDTTPRILIVEDSKITLKFEVRFYLPLS